MQTANGNGHQQAPSSYRTDRLILRAAHFGPQPQEIVVGDAPTEEQGQYGPQWRYFLEAPVDAILYASETMHHAMQAVIRSGYPALTVTKLKQGRKDVWDIQPTRGSTPPSDPAYWQTGTDRMPAAAGEAFKRAATPTPPQPQPAAIPASQRTATDARLLHCYITALALAAHAVRHAQDHHQLRITPDFADVRAIAATLFIDARDAK